MKRIIRKKGRREPRHSHVTRCDAIPPGELFFTKPEMAKLLKISLRTLAEMMGRGEIAYLKIGGRLVRFRLDDVQRRLTETCLHTATDAGIDTAATDTSSGLRPPSDSLAPARSALEGPSPSANSFRKFPTGSSPQSGEGIRRGEGAAMRLKGAAPR